MAEDPIKRVTLPEVTISAKKIDPKRYKATVEKVKLYPKGEVAKTTIDSLTKAGRGSLMGEPMQKDGQMAMYGSQASDNIKQLMKRK